MTDTPHKDFAAWYTSVDLGDAPERLQARADGVTLLIEEIAYEHCEHFTDIVLGKPGACSGPGGDLMRAAFTNFDPAFPTHGNEAEMATLAEITLAVLMDHSETDELVGRVANLVYTSLVGGARKISSVTDLVNRANDTMRRQGQLIRARTAKPISSKTLSPTIDFDDCFDEVTNLADLNQARAMMKKVAAKTARVIGLVARQAQTERKALQKQLKIQDEELDLLWWASSGQSDMFGALFSTIEPGARALLVATEAALRTQFLPGPSSIRGLMEKAGVSAKKTLSIADAVNAADTDWLRSIEASGVTTRSPLHLAIEQKLQSPDSEAWASHWSAVIKVDATAKLKELEIAHLFYQERLVLEAYGGA